MICDTHRVQSWLPSCKVWYLQSVACAYTQRVSSQNPFELHHPQVSHWQAWNHNGWRATLPHLWKALKFLAVNTGIDETKVLIRDSSQDLKLAAEYEDQKHEATGMGCLLLIVQSEQLHHNHKCLRGTKCYPVMKMNAWRCIWEAKDQRNHGSKGDSLSSLMTMFQTLLKSHTYSTAIDI